MLLIDFISVSALRIYLCMYIVYSFILLVAILYIATHFQQSWWRGYTINSSVYCMLMFSKSRRLVATKATEYTYLICIYRECIDCVIAYQMIYSHFCDLLTNEKLPYILNINEWQKTGWKTEIEMVEEEQK